MPTAEKLIKNFCRDVAPNHRYASFDYCFNYFQSFKSKREIAAPQNMEKSCMQLRAYLASWGMFRASSFLLQKKSMRHFQKVIGVIASKQQAPLWRIDCDEYGEDAKVHLQNVYEAIRWAVVPGREAHLTLVTKIMLGVFGCVPAFDSRFTDTMRRTHGWRCRFRSFNGDALDGIAAFYREYHKVVDRWSKKTRTFDFDRGQRSQFNYTRRRSWI
jgi:hypothetical protein